MNPTKQRYTRYTTTTSRITRTLILATLCACASWATDASATPSASAPWQMPAPPAGLPQPSPNPYAPTPFDASDGEDDQEEAPPYFDIMVGTQVPIAIGGLLSLELPGRILLQGELGWMPPAYGSAINGVVQGFGAYDESIRDLVDGSLDDAFVGRVSGGWRPVPSAGFEIFAGYTYVGLSGNVSPESVADVVGGAFAQQVAARALSDDVAISSSLHNVHVGLGWRWVAFDHLAIRLTAAYMQTLASSTSIETPELPAAAAIANPLVDEEMSEIYTDYVKLPVIGLHGGYRF